MRSDRDESRRLMREIALSEGVMLYEALPKLDVTVATLEPQPKRKKSRTPHKHRGRPF